MQAWIFLCTCSIGESKNSPLKMFPVQTSIASPYFLRKHQRACFTEPECRWKGRSFQERQVRKDNLGRRMSPGSLWGQRGHRSDRRPKTQAVEFFRKALDSFSFSGGAEDQDQGPRMRNEKMIDHMKVKEGPLPMIDESQSITRIIPREIRLLMDFQLNDRFLTTIITSWTA